MQNYIKAVREFLENDIDVQAFTSNIHFLRVPKEKSERPLIIFTEQGKQNPYNSEWGRDVFDLLFEVIVDYEDAVKGRECRELLKKKFSSFHWQLTQDRNWYIWFIEDIDIGYDDTNDVVRRGTVYQFKAKRDL